MKVAITGSTGLVGSALVPFLTTAGHRVSRLVRSGDVLAAEDIAWNPSAGTIDTGRLEGIDAVVHLAGENISAQRWSAKHKARVRDSRVLGTRLLCETLAKLQKPPKVLVNASATGYYGNRGDEELTEASSNGSGFLPELCREWEAATEAAASAGIRVIMVRFGIILSPRGGALPQMLTPFRSGLGGTVGTGKQWISWISLDDAVGCIYHVIATESLRGPVNGVAPKTVTNLEFTKTLGTVLSVPTVVPMPAFMARLAFGEMADELLLASTRVDSRALRDSAYQFLYPELEGALRHLLGKDHRSRGSNESEGLVER